MTEVVFTSELTAEVVQVLGSDAMVAASARVSTGRDLSEHDESKDKGLIGYLMRSRHGCYDDQTEVLTSKGWVPFPDVDGSETFVTLDAETQEIRHSKASRVIRKEYSGPMVRVKTQQVDLLVTPDHRMVGEARRKGGWGQVLSPSQRRTCMNDLTECGWEGAESRDYC